VRRAIRVDVGEVESSARARVQTDECGEDEDVPSTARGTAQYHHVLWLVQGAHIRAVLEALW